MLYEETTNTLLCGDIGTHVGNGPPITEGDIVAPATKTEDLFQASSLTPQTAPTIRTLAELKSTTLAIMHGSSFAGDGATVLQAIADDYQRRHEAAGA